MTPPVREIDIVIAGGGIVAMTAALDLAREGRGILIIDEGRHSGTNNNAGSLHVQMQSRFIRMYPDQVAGVERSLPLYVAAVRRWRDLAEELGADFELKSSGGLMVAEDAIQLAFLRSKCERERRLGLDVDILDRADLGRLAPYLGEAVFGAELCRDEGKLSPLKANEAIRRALAGLGVQRMDAARVARVESSNSWLMIYGSAGKEPFAVRAGHLLIAAGAGTGQLAGGLGIAIPTVAEPLHMNITEAAPPLIGHLVQHADRMITLKQLGAGQVVIGGGWPARFAGPREFPAVRPGSMIGNLALAQRIVPELGALRVIRTWAGVNTTADGQCILGPPPQWPNVCIAVPGDAGYTLGPLVGRAAAALVLGRRPEFDTKRFSPARFLANGQ